MISRRGVLVTMLWPIVAHAQQADRPHRIGWLQPAPIPDSWLKGFRQGLREFNLVEGKDVILEYRWGDGNFDRLPAMAGELVQLEVDVIISSNTAALLAAQRATPKIPIVMIGANDPTSTGLAAGLAHPGGNTTGLSTMAPETSGKRLALLGEVVPKLARIVVLTNPENPGAVVDLKALRAAGQTLGLDVVSVDVGEPSAIDGALSAALGTRPDALVVVTDTMIHGQLTKIANFAAMHRLPSIASFREFAPAGGLMSYGPNLPDIFRRGAGYVKKILEGVSPRELPIEQPANFDLLINLSTAKALGLTIPPSLLARADEVIE